LISHNAPADPVNAAETHRHERIKDRDETHVWRRFRAPGEQRGFPKCDGIPRQFTFGFMQLIPGFSSACLLPALP
jgi:hypothetical protein